MSTKGALAAERFLEISFKGSIETGIALNIV
jgi:hypothetical protein